MKRYILSAIAGGALTIGAALAQSTAPSSPPPPGSNPAERQHYDTRQTLQQDRIQNGVNNGSLTQRQGAALDRQDARINREAHTMAKRNGGSLSDKQEARIHHQMNRQSRRINRAKH